METQTATTSATRSRFGKLGTLVRRSSATPSFRPPSDSAKVLTEDWYIPYTGPIASPKEKERKRDSWGQLVDEELDHYMSGGSDANWLGDGQPQQTRGRVLSGLTMSSGALDPSRKSFGSMRQPRPAQPANQATHKSSASFVSLDPSGGVADTPMPIQRNMNINSSVYTPSASKLGGAQNRMSIASIFSFGKPDRLSGVGPAKTIASSSNALPISNAPSLHLHTQSINYDAGPSTAPPEAYNRSFRDVHFSQGRSRGLYRDNEDAQSTRLPAAPEDDVSSSYSNPSQPLDRTPPPTQTQVATIQGHPYASATPFQPSKNVRLVAPLLTPRISSGSMVPKHLRPTKKLLKSSLSTPNLRNAAARQGQQVSSNGNASSGIPRGADRWLSAETWCDVFMRPRPRFKLTLVDEDGREIPQLVANSSGRIVSPPGSPIWAPNATLSQQQASSRHTASRDHQSSSHHGRVSSPGHAEEEEEEEPVQPIRRRPRGNTLPSNAAPPNKALRRYSKDDLALPSPVPSLADVLRSGERLEKERAAWQKQASGSFLNGRARTLSLSRSSSRKLTKPRSLARGTSSFSPDTDVASSFDFLAARTLHGSQGVPAHISTGLSSKASAHSHTQSAVGGNTTIMSSTSQGTRSRGQSHSRKSSGYSMQSSPGRGHRRSESWGKNALRKAKSTACLDTDRESVPNGDAGNSGARRDDWLDALQPDGTTKVIRLHEQLYSDARRATTSPSAALGLIGNRQSDNMLLDSVDRETSTYTYSAEGVASDGAIGLAVSSTPTPELKREGPEPIIFESHPFAHYSVDRRPKPPTEKSPAPPSATADNAFSSNAAAVRHRLPPQVSLLSPSYSQHPYAAAFAGQSFDDVPTVSNSSRPSASAENIPLSAAGKKFAEVPSGQVREVRPDELLYSPLSPAPTPLKKKASRNSENVGVEEALSFAFGRTRSGTISSTGRHIVEDAAETAEVEELEEDGTVEGDVNGSVSDSQEGMIPPPPPPVRQEPVKFDEDPSPDQSGSLRSPELIATNQNKLSPPPIRGHHSDQSFGSLGGRSSSTGPSPHVLGDIDDGFDDLFFHPVQQSPPQGSFRNLRTAITRGGSSSTDQHAARPESNFEHTFDSPASSMNGSGLTRLARQLSEEYPEFQEDDTFGVRVDTQMLGSRFGGLKGSRNGPTQDFNSALNRSEQSSQAQASPSLMTLPLRFSQGEEESPLKMTPGSIPEDVQSFASSDHVNRAASPEGGNVENFRVRSVATSTTPYPDDSEYRASATLSLILDNFDAELREFTAHADAHHAHFVNGMRSSNGSNLHINPETRASYMTAVSTGSRISGLSDFPSPPDTTLDHRSLMAAIESEGPTPAETIYHTPAMLTPIPSAEGTADDSHEPDLLSPIEGRPNLSHLSSGSHVTDGTDNSRISGLSEFPLPPSTERSEGKTMHSQDPVPPPSPLNLDVPGPFHGSPEAEYEGQAIRVNVTRDSAMTAGTIDESRISGLSAFPEPPITRSTPVHTMVLSSYFPAGTPEPQNHDGLDIRDMSDAQKSSRSSRRTTFGVDVAEGIELPGSL